MEIVLTVLYRNCSFRFHLSLSQFVIPTDEVALAAEERRDLLSLASVRTITARVFSDNSEFHMPHGEQRSYVYIMASKSRVLYTGVTSRLEARIREHKIDAFGGFTTRYRVHRLVYFELFSNIRPAIRREKQIKRWRREKRVALIEIDNPTWDDLAEEWRKQVPIRLASLAQGRLSAPPPKRRLRSG